MAQTKIKLIADGVIDANNLKAGHTITTDNIGEGTNLYYTDARVGSYLSTNSYATEGYVTTAVANLVDAAPSTLDTLNELAAALGDDPNFATTVTNSIATKLPLAGGTLTGNLIVNANLGIGIGSPSTNLEVYGIEPVIRLSGDGLNAVGTLLGEIQIFNRDTSTAGPNIAASIKAITAQSSGAGAHLIFGTTTGSEAEGTAAIERMRINSAGNVGIGTNTPSEKLDVYGNIKLGTTANSNVLNRSDSHWIQYNGGAQTNDTYVRVASVGATSIGRTISFHTNSSERIRIPSTGGMTVTNGNIAMSNGYGIDFSASAGAGSTSTLLDDYEEGTFTPYIIQGYTSVTYGFRLGVYTKIGNQVTVSLRLDIAAGTADSNRLEIYIPFTAAPTTTLAAASIGFWNAAGLSTKDPYALVGIGEIVFYRSNGSGGKFTGLDANDTSWAIHLTATFLV